MLIFVTICCWAILLGITIFCSHRGSSAGVCLGISLLCGVLLSSVLSPGMAHWLPVSARDAIACQGYWTMILFFFFSILGFALGIFLNRFIVWSFDPFDKIAGFMVGVVVAGLMAHYFLTTALLMTHGTQTNKDLNQLGVVRQIAHLEGWKSFTKWVVTATSAEAHPDPSTRKDIGD